nr:MAG TPA: hypothetical protein [Caudoviricetes sp.]
MPALLVKSFLNCNLIITYGRPKVKRLFIFSTLPMEF